MRPILAIIAAALVLQPPDKPPPHEDAASSVPYAVETVAENLEVPWDIVFVSADRMLFTERPGRVRLYENGKLHPEPYYTVPNVHVRRGGEIGLMGICLHPDYATSKFVYLSFGHTSGDVRVVRYKDTGENLVEDKIIIDGIPASVNHAGCAIGFGPDKKLYITTGEMFRKELAQDMMSLGGKTLRLNDDGSVPDDNPFLDRKEGALPEIWSLGHRNAQGMDWQPSTGLMFQSEHGPSGEAGRDGDEVNIVEAGKNYGWPIIHHKQTREGYESPLVEWTPAVAPASGTFYRGDKFPAWQGNFLVGALGGLRGDPTPGIIRIVLNGRKYVSQEFLVTTYGRIRAVEVGPDGYIYFSTSNRDGRARPAKTDDRIMRLRPRK
jgi:glucose/arabinose dehydrogenase